MWTHQYVGKMSGNISFMCQLTWLAWKGLTVFGSQRVFHPFLRESENRKFVMKDI